MQGLNDILVVDDDAALVDFLVSALREGGYLTCAAYDGESALFAIQTVHPALVLLDLHLPGLNGFGVVAHLQRHHLSHVPVVLMTGDTTAAAQLPTAEFPEYLLKPFDLDTLLSCIRRHVRPPHRHARSPITNPATPISTTNP